VKAQELSRKYATAVFSQALEKWITTLRMVNDRLQTDAALTTKLQDTTRSFSERQEALNQLLSQERDPHIRNFLYAMLRDGDILLLDEVIGELDQMIRGGPQVQIARVTTAMPLSDSDKEQFRQKLQQKYGSDLEFVFEVDPAIIGGAIVQIGDKVIDGSVATRLESMSNFLGIRS
jgi:F-type H+-transporting ATPase subunit delta